MVAYSSIIINGEIKADLPKVPVSAAAKSLGLAVGGFATLSGFAGTLLKWELIRDFYQILSVFFSSRIVINMPSIGIDIWNSITGFVSLNLPNLPFDFAGQLFLPILVVTSLIFVGLFYKQVRGRNDASLEGLHTETASTKGKWWKRSRWIVVTLLISLFLPVMDSSLRVLVCDSSTGTSVIGCDFGFFHVLSIVGILMFLYFPFALRKLIEASRPVLRPYDLIGTKLSEEHQQEVYIQDAKNSPSPYKHLFSPFTYKWSSYKVLVMVAKFCLIIPAIVLSSGNALFSGGGATLDILQSIFFLILLLAYLIIAYKTPTFVEKTDRLIELFSRISSFLIAFFGFLAVILPSFGIVSLAIISVIIIANSVFMLIFTAGGSSKGKELAQKITKSLDFTEDSQGFPIVLREQSDLCLDRVRRIWADFWVSLFTDYAPFASHEERVISYHRGAYPNAPPTLLRFINRKKGFKGTAGDRLIECIRIVQELGPDLYHIGLERQTHIHDIHNIYLYGTGIDLFYNGCFGSAYVVPFPFTLVFTSDRATKGVAEKLRSKIKLQENGLVNFTSDTISYLTDWEDMHKILSNLKDQSVISGILLRRKFRCLNSSTHRFVIQKVVKVTKTRTVRDSEGNTRTESYQVDCNATFTMGTAQLAQNLSISVALFTDADAAIGDINPSPGAAFSLFYSDGEGRDTEGDYHKNLQTSIGDEWFHYGNMYVDTHAEMQRLLAVPTVIERIESQMESIIKLSTAYRRQLYRDDYRARLLCLPYNFWNNILTQTMNRKTLEHYLETNPNNNLSGIVSKKRKQLDMLYKVLNQTQSKKNLVWFLFWDDIWRTNMDSKFFLAKMELLCPSFTEGTETIAFTPKTRDELEPWLVENKLRNKKKNLFTEFGYFRNWILDALYSRIGSVGDESLEPLTSPSLTPPPTLLPMPEENDLSVPEFAGPIAPEVKTQVVGISSSDQTPGLSVNSPAPTVTSAPGGDAPGGDAPVAPVAAPEDPTPPPVTASTEGNTPDEGPGDDMPGDAPDVTQDTQEVTQEAPPPASTEDPDDPADDDQVPQ